jgi:carbonic anhydrase/acetyltransferase-like protein (isoleucine patch superfamily)
MAIYQLGERVPQIHPSAWVSDEAVLIGSVVVGAHTSIWPHAVLRGDNEPIIVGDHSNVQDGAVLHTDWGCPLTLGSYVTVGHLAMLHGCMVEDGALIGLHATLLNNARIGAESLVGAGALVTSGKHFAPRGLIVGSPAQRMRELRPEEIADLRRNAQSYEQHAQEYRQHLKRIS